MGLLEVLTSSQHDFDITFTSLKCNLLCLTRPKFGLSCQRVLHRLGCEFDYEDNQQGDDNRIVHESEGQ